MIMRRRLLTNGVIGLLLGVGWYPKAYFSVIAENPS